MSLKTLTFELLTEKNGYCVYYAIPYAQRSLHCGKMNTIMIVIKDDKIVYIPDSNLDQFHMKIACDEFIESKSNECVL
jgi:hypothetical protein